MLNRVGRLVLCLVIMALAAPAMAVDYTFPSDNPGKDLNDFYKWAKGLTPSGELRILIENPSTDPANPTIYDDTSVYCVNSLHSKLIFRAANLSNPRPILRMNINVNGSAAASKQFAFSNAGGINGQGLPNSPNPTGVLELEHLEMTGIKANGTRGAAGISLVGRFYAGGITVKDCVIRDYADSGIETGEQEETEYAASEAPTGFIEVLDSVIHHCGSTTTHNMYIHCNAVVRNTEVWGGNQNSDVKIVGRYFEVSGCTLRDTKAPDDPENVLTKSSKLLDIAAFGRGAIFNNNIYKYRPSTKPDGLLDDIVDIRHRKEDIGCSLPPYSDPTNIQNEKAYWDMVKAGGASLADASNPEFFHIFVWNNGFHVTNFSGYTGSPETEVYTNWGTHPGCEWFPKKDQGYSVPFYDQWLERSVMWIADPTITYDTANMGTIYANYRNSPMRRNVEWKTGEGFDMPGLPDGNLKFVANTNVAGWWNGFSTLPSADAANPTTPTNVTAVEATGRRVMLKWTRSTDDVAVGGYHIYRNGTEIDRVGVPFFIDINVANNASYTYEVEAYDIRNKRSGKASINVSTAAATQRVARDDFQNATNATDTASGSGWASNWTFTGGVTIAAAPTHSPNPPSPFSTYEPDDATDSGGGPADPAPTPSRILRMRGSATATRTVDLSGAAGNVQMYIQWFKGKLEGTDQALVEVNDGTSWQTVLTIDRLSSKDWQIHDAYIDLSSYTKSATFQVRITASMSDTDDYVYFDDIELVDTTASMTTAPTAPSDLVASAGSNLVSLAWTDNSSDENGFLIERRLTADPDTAYEVIRLVPANTTNWVDRGYENLDDRQPESRWQYDGSSWTQADHPSAQLTTTLYTYRVRAYNQVNWSSYSTATTTGSTAPETPTDLVATLVSATQIDLTWTDVATDETSYKVYRATTSNGYNYSSPLATLSAGSTSYSDTTCQASTAYYYVVRAYKTAGGGSASSNQASATTPDDGETPKNLVATAASSSQINLTWTDVATDETGYKVFRATSSNGFNYSSPLATLGADSTSYSDTTCQASTTYYYAVRAYKTVGGDSASSNQASATTLSDAPATPTNLAATAVLPTQIDLTWTDVATDETGYKVYRATSSNGYNYTSPLATLGAGTASYSDTTCQTLVTYYYVVRAYKTVGGDSSPSNEASATTPSDGGATTVAHDDFENGFPGGYSSQWGGNWSTSGTVDLSTSSFKFAGVYGLRLGIITGVPAGVATRAVDMTGKTNAVLRLVYRTALFDTTDHAYVEISTDAGSSWNRVKDIVGAGANGIWVVPPDISLSSYTMNSQFQVRIRNLANANGEHLYIDNLEISAESAATAPAAPSNLTLTLQSGTEVQLDWQVNSTDETGFEIERKVGAGSFSLLQTINSAGVNTWTDTGLSASTQYTYRVRAIKSDSDPSGYSNEPSATTPSARLAGDIDGDGHVDVLDLLYFVDAFGSVPGDANYNPAADFNADDSVDVVDLLMLVENWGL